MSRITEIVLRDRTRHTSGILAGRVTVEVWRDWQSYEYLLVTPSSMMRISAILSRIPYVRSESRKVITRKYIIE